MPAVERYALLTLEIAVIAALIWRGWWRHVPLFVAYLLASIPLTVTFRPELRSWWHGPFESIAPIQVLLAIGATVEAIRNSSHDAHRPFLTWLWTLLAALGTIALIVVWEINDHPDTFAVVRDGRAAVLAGLAASSLTGLVALWLFPSSLMRFDARHLSLWSTLMLKGAVLGVAGRLGLYPKDPGGIRSGMRIVLSNVFNPSFGFPGVQSIKWGIWEEWADQCGALVTMCCLLLWIRAALKRGRIL